MFQVQITIFCLLRTDVGRWTDDTCRSYLSLLGAESFSRNLLYAVTLYIYFVNSHWMTIKWHCACVPLLGEELSPVDLTHFTLLSVIFVLFVASIVLFTDLVDRWLIESSSAILSFKNAWNGLISTEVQLEACYLENKWVSTNYPILWELMTIATIYQDME